MQRQKCPGLPEGPQKFGRAAARHSVRAGVLVAARRFFATNGALTVHGHFVPALGMENLHCGRRGYWLVARSCA